MMKRYVVSLFLLFAVSSFLYGQYGKISGKVSDRDTKEPIIGANIVLEGTSLGSSTDIEGNYVILNVPAGTYSLKASYIGYQTTTVTGVSVREGLTRSMDIQLVNTTVQLKAVEVVAERPLIEKTATNAVRIQSSEELQKLPVRGVQGYFTLQPGVVLQNGVAYVRGSRTEEVGYQIEGASVKDVVGTNARNNTTGYLVTTIPEALEEINVQSGGYGAEFGGANAGIVSQTFKTAGSLLNVTLQAETDNLGNYPGKKALGAYSSGYSDYVLTVGVPIIPDRIKLFVAGENNFQRDRFPTFWSGANFGYLKDNGLAGGNKGDSALVQWGDGNVPGTSNNRYTANGTLLFDYQPIQVRLGGAFTWSRNSNNTLIRNIFDLQRIPVGDNSNLLVNGKVSYFLSPKTFAEVSINYVDTRNKTYDANFGENLIQYGDSIAAAQHGWQYQTLTNGPANYNFAGFSFVRPGTGFNNFSKDHNGHIGGTFAFTSQVQNHEVKFGGSYEYHTISHYGIGPDGIYSTSLTDPNVTRVASEYAKSLRLNEVVNNYGYDEFGTPLTSGPDGPKHPYFGAAYVQDRIEMSDLIVNAGLRYDVINMDDWAFTNVTDLGYDSDNFLLSTAGKGKTYSYIEPRLGFSFPASDRTVFHLQYGKFVQAPPLYSAYRSRASAVYVFQGGHYFPNPIGFNLQPIRTTQYEVGFSQQISDAAMFDVTGFYKNIEGQLQVTYNPLSPTSPIPSYYSYTNGDFENVMGLEISIRMRRTSRLQAQINYTLQDARGTNSFANSAAALFNVTGGSVTPSMVVPMDYAQTHRGTVSLDYRWDKGDGGPILERLGFNLLFSFNSGHPFTVATGSGGQQGPDLGAILNDGDARTRFPEEPINNSTTPWVYTLDLRIDKTIAVGPVDLNVYVYVQNLLNTQNVVNVYYRTGNAYDDGWLSDPIASGKTVSQYGDTYSQLYNVVNLQNNQNQLRTNGFTNFGTPRQVRLGARIEF